MNKIFKNILAIAALIAAPAAFGQQAVDPYDLSFSENIALPEIPAKAQKPIKGHMAEIAETLKKHKVDVKLERSGEIVKVTIPCSYLFAPNETKLKESGKKYLNPYLNFLKVPTMYKLVIAVHSDESGEEQYLDELTEQRAEAIDEYLVAASNRDGENVIPYGLGPELSLVPNNSIENRDRNRRVEIYIVPEIQLIERAKSGKMN